MYIRFAFFNFFYSYFFKKGKLIKANVPSTRFSKYKQKSAPSHYYVSLSVSIFLNF